MTAGAFESADIARAFVIAALCSWVVNENWHLDVASIELAMECLDAGPRTKDKAQAEPQKYLYSDTVSPCVGGFISQQWRPGGVDHRPAEHHAVSLAAGRNAQTLPRHGQQTPRTSSPMGNITFNAFANCKYNYLISHAKLRRALEFH